MNLRELGLVRELSEWEVKRTERLLLEDKFRNFTGHAIVFEPHIPYARFDLLENAIKEDSKLKCKKMFVINGDACNLDMFSAYRKTSTCKSKPSDEFKSFVHMLNYASKIYDHIIFVKANHDERPSKIISYLTGDKEVGDEIRTQMETYKALFDKNNVKVTISPMYLFQVGELIMTHIEKNHKNPYTTAHQIWEDLTPRMARYWTTIMQSHTHSQGQYEINGKRIIMTGALTGTMDYSRAGKFKYRYSTVGYGVAYLNKGVVDMDKTTYRVRAYEEKA